MSDSPNLADRFHSALVAGDAAQLRALVSDEVTFTGPVATATGADQVVAGLVQMSELTSSDVLEVRLADEDNALIWSSVRVGGAPAVETATWLRLAGGVIVEIRTVFATPRTH